MLANHTSIRSLFKVILNQERKMKKRNAYIDQYKAFDLFKDGTEEFDSAEESVQKLIEEYEAAEKEDYINWGMQEDLRDGGGAGNDGGNIMEQY